MTLRQNKFRTEPHLFNGRAALVAVVLLLIATVTPGCVKNSVKPQTGDAAQVQSAHSGKRYFYYTLARVLANKGQLTDAVELLNKAGTLDPDSAFIQRELVLLHLKNKDSQKALEVVAAGLEKHPEDVVLLNIYGRLLEEKKDLEGAARIYEKILALDPTQENVYLFLGGVYRQLERWSEAEAVYQKMIKDFPKAYAGYFFLGRIYGQQGKQDQAEKAFLESLAINPGLEEPKFELAALYLASGQTEKAIEQYRNLLAGNPKNVKAALGLALLYQDNKQSQEAVAVFVHLAKQSLTGLEVAREVVRQYIDPKKYESAAVLLEGIFENGPASRDLHYLLGVAYEGLEAPDMAIDEMKKITAEDKFFEDAVVRTAFLYQDQGKHNRAIAHLQAAINTSPDNLEFYFYLGTLYEETGALTEALDTLAQGQARGPDNVKIQFRLGVVHDKMGNKNESIRAMERVLELDANHASALNYLGYTYADLGKNLAEAEQLIVKALKFKPDDGYITDSLGWVYYKQGRYSEALDTLIKAVGMVSDDPIILEHLGDAYLKQNQRKKALESYKQALQVKEKEREPLEKKIKDLEQLLE